MAQILSSRKSKLAALCITLASTMLGACTSTTNSDTAQILGQGPLNTATEAEALKGFENNLKIESRLLNDYELIKQVPSQLDNANIFDSKMRVANLKQKCLVPFMVSTENSNQIYWDGKCSADGVATGLGRLVRAKDGKKVSEVLAEVDPKDPKTLYTYLRYDTATGDSEVGYSVIKLVDDKLTGYSATLGYNDEEWKKGNFDLAYRYEDTSNFVSYTKIIDLLNGEYSSIIAYPNFSHDLLNAHDNVQSGIDKTYRLLEGRTMIGMSYIWLKDGRLVQRDNEKSQDTVVKKEPQALTDYVDNIQERVAQNVDKIESDIDKGFAKVETYYKQKCKRPTPFFRGDEVNQVCDYLFNVSAAYDDLVKAKQAKALEIEEFKNNQAKALNTLYNHLKAFNEAANAAANNTGVEAAKEVASDDAKKQVSKSTVIKTSINQSTSSTSVKTTSVESKADTKATASAPAAKDAAPAKAAAPAKDAVPAQAAAPAQASDSKSAEAPKATTEAQK